MQRLRQRHAHQAGRRNRAIEPRELHHLDDGADAGAFGADAPRVGIVKLDFRRCVRLVAELVLQLPEMQAVDAAVRPEARHEETGQPAVGLRQHQKRRRTSAPT